VGQTKETAEAAASAAGAAAAVAKVRLSDSVLHWTSSELSQSGCLIGSALAARSCRMMPQGVGGVSSQVAGLHAMPTSSTSWIEAPSGLAWQTKTVRQSR
jgi:hypothetical protein